MKTTAIYGLFDPRNPDVIMYVGKGPAVRAQCHWRNFINRDTACNGRLLRWFASLLADGVKAQWQFIEKNVTDWEEREKHWIAHWREKNPQLCNVLDGGNQWPIDAGKLGGRSVQSKYRGTPEYFKWHQKAGRKAVASGQWASLKTKEHQSSAGRIGGYKQPHEAKVRGGRNGKREAKSRAGRNGIRTLHERYGGTPEYTEWTRNAGRVGGLKGGRNGTHRRFHLNRDQVNMNCDLCWKAAQVAFMLAGLNPHADDAVAWMSQFQTEAA
jgi:hypothetical protein